MKSHYSFDKYIICAVLIISVMLLGGCQKTQDIPLNIIDDNYRNYYEIFVYSFYDSDGDGIGDLNGVDEKLGYIKDMGFNGIWLMPVMPSTTYHKYDVTDYKDIDPEYGTVEDMKKLVDDAHKNDINVIIDFVMNHSSSKHPWFIEATEYLSEHDDLETAEPSHCLDYYHFSHTQLNNTYYPVPGCSNWYYEGSFWSEMPDLNFQSEKLWKEFEDITDFWVEEIGVDGFRMDATMHFEEGDTGFNTEVMNRIYEYAKTKNPDFYMVSEVWSSEDTISDYYQSRTDSLFNFDLGGPEGKIIKTAMGKQKMASLVENMKKYEEDFGSNYDKYIDAPFITNHDMGRVCNALQSDSDALKFAGGLLLSMDGSPYVYYGEEIGMKSKGNKDENKRLPMQWENADTGNPAGMTQGPKNADRNIKQSFPSVYEQQNDPLSILNYYKRALLIRNQNPEIARGKIEIINTLTEDYHAFIVKSYNDSKIGIAYNNSVDESFEMNVSLSPLDNPVVAGYLTTDNQEPAYDGVKIVLPPRSIVYFKEE